MQTFDCPKCGAPVSYNASAFGQTSARCSYCQSQLALPHHGQPARIISQIDINVSPQVTSGAKKLIWILVLVPIVDRGHCHRRRIRRACAFDEIGWFWFRSFKAFYLFSIGIENDR